MCECGKPKSLRPTFPLLNFVFFLRRVVKRREKSRQYKIVTTIKFKNYFDYFMLIENDIFIKQTRHPCLIKN